MKNPSLIRPYLERDVILPVLSENLKFYSPAFLNLIVQYPYMSNQARFFFKYHSHTDFRACPDCYNKLWPMMLSKIRKSRLDQKQKESIIRLFKNETKSALAGPCAGELIILDQLIKAVDDEDLKSIKAISNKGVLLSSLRFAAALNAIPQVNRSHLPNVKRLSSELGCIDSKFIEHAKEEELMAKVLKIDYNPKMPIDDYLDIILPRRKKISELINRVLEQNNKENYISQVNDALWAINKEVNSSKSLETLNFVSELVSSNAGLISSLIVGAAIGFSSANLLGCGLGSAGGAAAGIASKKVAQHGKLKIPKYPTRTKEWLKAKLESPQERLISILLCKDLNAIQIWSLRKKLQSS